MKHDVIFSADLGLQRKKNQLITCAVVAVLHAVALWAVSMVKTTEIRTPRSVAMNVSFIKAPTPTAQPQKQPEAQPEPVKPQPKPIEPVIPEKKVIAVKKADTPQQVQQAPAEPIKKVTPTISQTPTPPVTATPAEVKAEPKAAPTTSPPATSKAEPQFKYVDFDNDGVQWKKQPVVSFDNSELRNANRSLLLQIEANEKGEITAVKVLQSSGIAFVDAKVSRAVRAAKLKPYLENGVAYPVKAKQLFNFKLS